MAACACAGGVGTPCSNNLISGTRSWGLRERVGGRRIQVACLARRPGGLIKIAPEAYASRIVGHVRGLTTRAIDQCACDGVWRRLIRKHSVLTCPRICLIYPPSVTNDMPTVVIVASHVNYQWCSEFAFHCPIADTTSREFVH